jgi:hypothetical protein
MPCHLVVTDRECRLDADDGSDTVPISFELARKLVDDSPALSRVDRHRTLDMIEGAHRRARTDGADCEHAAIAKMHNFYRAQHRAHRSHR